MVGVGVGVGVMEERRDYVTLSLPAVPQPAPASRSCRRVSECKAPARPTLVLHHASVKP